MYSFGVCGRVYCCCWALFDQTAQTHGLKLMLMSCMKAYTLIGYPISHITFIHCEHSNSKYQWNISITAKKEIIFCTELVTSPSDLLRFVREWIYNWICPEKIHRFFSFSTNAACFMKVLHCSIWPILKTKHWLDALLQDNSYISTIIFRMENRTYN